jgi:hypothetical protein
VTGALGLNDIYDNGLGWGNALSTVGGGAAIGASLGLAGGPFAPITVPAGAAVGAGLGGVAALGTEVLRQYNAQPVPPASLSTGATVVNSSAQFGDIVVNNPTSDVDVKRAVRDAIEEAESERGLRGSVGVGLGAP